MLQLSSAGKRFGQKLLFEDANWLITPDERTGLVGGNGTVQSVQVGSTFAGTPTGTCALEIAKEARFPGFKRERQQFRFI